MSSQLHHQQAGSAPHTQEYAVDLTHSLSSSMPVFPGTEPPGIVEACNLAEHGFLEKRITMFSHTGTHIDAPAHLFTDGRTLGEYPVSHFLGRALVYRHESTTETIGRADLEPFAKDLQGADFLLLATGWDRYWGDSKYFSGFPTLSPDAARWLLQFPLKGIGLDTISADPIDAAELPVHQILLGQGMVIVENLTNLMILPAKHCFFSCLPLALPDADGSPVRAIALLTEAAAV